MKKLFNNSTKAEVQGQGKGKRKFLKTFSFASLALLMGIAGTMAFAPLGASPSVANASELETTTEQGLITPKADDPVIYTTESGLDIKYGNLSQNTSLGSGNLSGFPYFTTTSGSTTYTWVIIGRNSDTTVFGNAMTSYLFSTWKSTHNSTQGANFNTDGYYFFNNTYETTTPAGNAINIATASKSYVSDLGQHTLVKTNSEIPSGCVLVLANDCVATGPYNITYAYGDSAYRFAHYRSDTGSDFKDAMDGYYTNKSLGLSFLINANLIPSVSVKTYLYAWIPSTWAWRVQTVNANIFPLCSRANGSTFTWSTYLTATQMKLSGSQWLRGGGDGTNGGEKVNGIHHFYGEYMDESGTHVIGSANKVFGYRPAFCLKI